MAKKEVYTAVLAAQVFKLQEFTANLQSESGRKNYFKIARQMVREGRDVISVCCMKNDVGYVVSDADGMKNIWRKYMEKLLNVENDWDGEVDYPEVMGPPQPPLQQLQHPIMQPHSPHPLWKHPLQLTPFLLHLQSPVTPPLTLLFLYHPLLELLQ